MAGFGGEIGAKIESVSISRPSNGFHDLTLRTVDGAYLHITGDNDMVQLLEDALKNYHERRIDALEQCTDDLEKIQKFHKEE
jgi:hypothetical protein